MTYSVHARSASRVVSLSCAASGKRYARRWRSGYTHDGRELCCCTRVDSTKFPTAVYLDGDRAGRM